MLRRRHKVLKEASPELLLTVCGATEPPASLREEIRRRRLAARGDPMFAATRVNQKNARWVERLENSSGRRVLRGLLGLNPAKTGLPNGSLAVSRV
jgi:hypothetical protein